MELATNYEISTPQANYLQKRKEVTHMKELMTKILTDKKTRSAKGAKKAALSSTAYVPWSGIS